VPGIIQSIRRFGFRDPIEVIYQVGDEVQDEPRLIVAGAGRWMAIREMGYTEIPAELQTWDSMVSARGYGLANNKLTDSSQFDRGMVLETLQELIPLPGGIDGTGFTIGELEILQEEDDQEPEFPNYDEDVADEVVWNECPECQHKWPR